jgi:transcriptional regulator GlxA family with amidase domain
MSRLIEFYVSDGFQLLDLSGPLTAFRFAEKHSPGTYTAVVVSDMGASVKAACGVSITSDTPGKARDTLIVVGAEVLDIGFSADSGAIATMALHSRRVASICTGAFRLAAAGLLDGKRATTHWRYAPRLQAEFPKVVVKPDKIFIKDGCVWTSAGITAGIDLALALIEEDVGTAVARRVAQDMVVYHRRPGGQTQFSALLEMAAPTERVGSVLQYARDHLNEDLSVDRLAEVVGLSSRQFSRAFVAETGQTPAKAIERLRAEAAKPLIEESAASLKDISRSVGFSDPERMRQAFIRAFGYPPRAARRIARDENKASRMA